MTLKQKLAALGIQTFADMAELLGLLGLTD